MVQINEGLEKGTAEAASSEDDDDDDDGEDDDDEDDDDDDDGEEDDDGGAGLSWLQFSSSNKRKRYFKVSLKKKEGMESRSLPVVTSSMAANPHPTPALPPPPEEE